MSSNYKLSAFVMATEEKAPVEWAAERIVGVRKARAYAILREIGAHSDLEAWLCQKVLVGMESGRIGRGRETRPWRSPMPSSSRSPVVRPKPGAAPMPGRCGASRPAGSGSRRSRRGRLRGATTWSTPASFGGFARTVSSGDQRDRVSAWAYTASARHVELGARPIMAPDIRSYSGAPKKSADVKAAKSMACVLKPGSKHGKMVLRSLSWCAASGAGCSGCAPRNGPGPVLRAPTGGRQGKMVALASWCAHLGNLQRIGPAIWAIRPPSRRTNWRAPTKNGAFRPRKSAIFRHVFPCPFRVPASLGPGLRTASGARGRRGGPCHRAMMSTMSKEERMSLESELAAALAAGKSCAEWASANGVSERTAQRWASDPEV